MYINELLINCMLKILLCSVSINILKSKEGLILNKKILSALIMNILIAVSTAAIAISYYFYCENPLVQSGFDSYKFFTTDSNILAGLASLILIPFEIQILRGKRKKLPRAAVLFKYAAAVSLTLTFTTVMVLLLPIYDIKFLLLGTAFYMHIAGPVMTFISFVFLETDTKIKLPESLIPLIPVILYGAVYLTEVVIIGEKNGGWMDFYTFNKGGNWMISMPIMLGATYLISFLIRLLHNRFSKD